MSAAGPGPGEGLARLHAERDFLLASIEDLDTERAAGDISEEDYARLRAAYVARAAGTLRAVAALESAPPPSPPAAPGRVVRLRRFLGRRRTRAVLGIVGLVCALGIVTITAAHFAGVRLPGEVATGSVELPSATTNQQLARAAQLDAKGEIAAAIGVYDAILRSDPRQPEALAYRGWLLRLTGVAGRNKVLVLAGDVGLAAAVRVAPQSATARALDGVALFEDEGRPAAALTMFRAALADHPSRGLLRLAGRTMAAAFAEEHVALPPVLERYRPH